MFSVYGVLAIGLIAGTIYYKVQKHRGFAGMQGFDCMKEQLSGLGNITLCGVRLTNEMLFDQIMTMAILVMISRMAYLYMGVQSLQDQLVSFRE